MNSQGHGPGAAKQGMDITATLGRKQIYDGKPGIAGEEKNALIKGCLLQQEEID